MTRRRRIVSVAVAVVVLAAAIGIWRWRAGTSRAPVRVDTARVDQGRILAKVTATGTLSAIVTVQVGSQVSGRVAALYADFNSPVKKGQRIAKIDPQLFQAAVEQARANYVAAQGNLAKTKAQGVDADRQFTRNKALAERKLIAQADLDTSQANAEAAKASVDAAQGAVEQARAALHQAQVNLDYTDIISPTSGVVISRNVDVGQTVAASLQAPTLFVIAEDLAKMQVDTSVAEADVGRLTPGMKASFTVDAYPSDTFEGTVRQIRNSPQTVQNVVTYDAVIDVANPDFKLKPGMTANVTFVYADKDDVVRIANAALRFRPTPDTVAAMRGGNGGRRSGGGAGGGPRGGPRADPAGGSAGPDRPDQHTVWVVRADGPAPVRIRTGISDGTLTEIVEGDLKPGDAVVTDASGPAGGFAAGLRRPF